MPESTISNSNISNSNRSPDKSEITSFFQDLQDTICRELEKADGKEVFAEESWQREGGGGGRSRVLQDGHVFEKAGVNFSSVHGQLPDKIMKSFNVEQDEFYATGISLVLHPRHPYVPITHMNLRYFELEGGRHWFGGGIDITPHYINPQEAALFHQGLKIVCQRHDVSYYERFKDWADRYFFIPHRNETRGIGGVFFDRLQPDELHTSLDLFSFVKDLGANFLPLYLPQVYNNLEKEYGLQQKDWQLLRRSRYVEFNLVYDAGTRFGLETNGRTESILMSLPPMASWKYSFTPNQGSAEEQTMHLLKPGIDWINT